MSQRIGLMSDADCTAFLQWALPRLNLRWPGFRKVHRQVCKRLKRRMSELQLTDFAAYRARLEADPAEWQILDQSCHITISRFSAIGAYSRPCANVCCPKSPPAPRGNDERHAPGRLGARPAKSHTP